ncbi:MAG: Hsp20/alpha crystallin family protein [Chloroflexi bacterium]|nr:Hsp20/alpha crystallin family protein [Chloroflexota bacterium]
MTQITVFDPFHEVRAMMRRVNEDPFFFPARGKDRSLGWRSRNSEIAPPIDAYKTEGALKVETPLPGFSADEIDVSLEKGVLAIRAEHTSEHTGETTSHASDQGASADADRTYVVRERYSGAASRSILIGEEYDADSVEATLKDGVLTLTIQMLPEVQPKQITVKVG